METAAAFTSSPRVPPLETLPRPLQDTLLCAMAAPFPGPSGQYMRVNYEVLRGELSDTHRIGPDPELYGLTKNIIYRLFELFGSGACHFTLSELSRFLWRASQLVAACRVSLYEAQCLEPVVPGPHRLMPAPTPVLIKSPLPSDFADIIRDATPDQPYPRFADLVKQHATRIATDPYDESKSAPPAQHVEREASEHWIHKYTRAFEEGKAAAALLDTTTRTELERLTRALADEVLRNRNAQHRIDGLCIALDTAQRFQYEAEKKEKKPVDTIPRKLIRDMPDPDYDDYMIIDADTTLTDEEKKKRKKSNEENACVICLVRPRRVVLMPCGHIVLCITCARDWDMTRPCPVARESIERLFGPVYDHIRGSDQ